MELQCASRSRTENTLGAAQKHSANGHFDPCIICAKKIMTNDQTFLLYVLPAKIVHSLRVSLYCLLKQSKKPSFYFIVAPSLEQQQTHVRASSANQNEAFILLGIGPWNPRADPKSVKSSSWLADDARTWCVCCCLRLGVRMEQKEVFLLYFNRQ